MNRVVQAARTVARQRLSGDDGSAVIEVVTRLPQPISADGEVVTLTPARFGVQPLAVSIYAPEGASAGAAERATASVPEPQEPS